MRQGRTGGGADRHEHCSLPTSALLAGTRAPCHTCMPHAMQTFDMFQWNLYYMQLQLFMCISLTRQDRHTAAALTNFTTFSSAALENI